MNKKDYYRILGIREDADTKEIKAAYEDRIKKLNSPDYADDPEYTQRKISETKYAYSVVMGSAPPATKQQKKAFYEKYKDAVDRGDEPRDFAERAKKRNKTLNAKVAAANVKKKINSTLSGMDINGKPVKPAQSAATIAFTVIISIIGLMFSMVQNMSDSYTNDYSGDHYIESNYAAVQRVLDRYEEYDFDTYLENRANVPSDKIEWEISDEEYSQLWELTSNLAYSMDIDSVSDAIAYITGDEDFYWENDDLTNSEVIISIMDAPEFKEVAGKVNAYTGEVILNYSSYMGFLSNVAGDQTASICGEPVEYF